MAKIKVTQIKSSIKRPKDQILTLEALGLTKIGRTLNFNLQLRYKCDIIYLVKKR